MKKKTYRPLVLTRDTLKHLADARLREVAGGSGTACDTRTTSWQGSSCAAVMCRA